MTLEEFKALKGLQDRRVRMIFTDGRKVIATLISISTDLDESRHLIYGKVEWSASPHAMQVPELTIPREKNWSVALSFKLDRYDVLGRLH